MIVAANQIRDRLPLMNKNALAKHLDLRPVPVVYFLFDRKDFKFLKMLDVCSDKSRDIPKLDHKDIFR